MPAWWKQKKNGKVKPESDANIVSPVVECEREDEEKMGDYNCDISSTAQSVKFKALLQRMKLFQSHS